jgi:hypothetical protein
MLVKTPQVIINTFLGILGLAMIIHFWGDLTASGIVSDVVGVALIIIGLISVTLYIRRPGKKDGEN